MTVRTVTRASRLEAPADAVFRAVRRPGTLVHVARPLVRFPDLEGRVEDWREGETTRTRVRLFGVVPFSLHRLTLERIDEQSCEMQSDEGGGLVRSWRHLITVTPEGSQACRYVDEVSVDAGWLTPVVAAWATVFYAWRQRRWRSLAKHGLG